MDSSLLEQFALADDRTEVARRAVPGTEEDTFLTTLLHQQRGELKEARRLLDTPGRSGRHRQALLLRQLLLEASAGDSKAWEALAGGARFDHRCQLPGKTPPPPALMPPALLARETVLHQSVSRAAQGVAELTACGLALALNTQDLPGPLRRKALERLDAPMHPRLIDLLAEDLGPKAAKNFGNLPLHGKLTVGQAEALLARLPELLESERFVSAHLDRLERDPRGPAGEEARVERLISFAERLSPAFAARQAALYLRRIGLRWCRGEADRDGLLRYLTCTAPPPRDIQSRTQLSGHPADNELLLAVLRACLQREDPGGLKALLSERFLREQQAEAMLLSGAPGAERWASALGATRLRELQERVALELAPENPPLLGADEDVTLLLDVKNIDTLFIRIFHIDNGAFYRAHGRSVDLDIDLDGFVPNQERVLRLDQPPMLRHRVALSLPEAKAPGTHIVDIMGGGLSCRALLRKGRLQAVERVGSAGLVLTILDEHQRPVQGATVWLGDRAFEAEPEGAVVVPFSSSPGARTVLLQKGSITTLQSIRVPAESYALRASFHVEQEDLMPGNEARLLVRAELLAAGGPASLSLLERPRLTLSATCDGISSERSYEEVLLDEQGYLLVTFTVPERLDHLQFSLESSVTDLQGQRRPVSATGGIQGSGLRTTQQIRSLHLLDEPGGWGLLALGRAGEPVAELPVLLEFWHELSTRPVTATLQTDARGLVGLGPLPGVTRLKATSPGGASLQRELRRSTCEPPPSLQLPAGEGLRLPVSGVLQEGEPTVGLFATDEAGALFHDHSDRVRVRDGTIEVDGLEAGLYRLFWLQEGTRSVQLAVTENGIAGWRRVQGKLLGPGPRPPARLRVTRGDGQVQIRIDGASPRARVHLFATTLAHPLPGLSSSPRYASEARPLDPPGNGYASARALGDEARYILARRHAPRRAGNMLPRPALLLNPWAVSDTSTTSEQLKEGGAYHSGELRAMSSAMAPPAPQGVSEGAAGRSPELDFLARPALVLANLRPDAQGLVTFPEAALEGRGVLRVLLLDDGATVGCQTALSPTAMPLRDRRVKHDLDPELGHALLGEVTTLAPGDTLRLGGAKYRIYDALPKAWSLLETLDPGQRCTRLEFLKRWPSLPEELKRKHYSESACHELNFFLYRKDRPFFDGVIRPYLASKRHRTFLDRYLLGDDLTPFRAPSRFARLNALERVLLAERLGELDDERDAQQAALEQQPVDLQQQERLFRAALQADALSEEPSPEVSRSPAVSRPKARSQALGGIGSGGGAMKMAKMSRRREARDEDESESEVAQEAMMDLMLSDAAEDQERDEQRRVTTRQLYRPLDATREYAEQHYHRQRVGALGPQIAPLNAFWAALAAHRGPGPFLSPHFLRCTDGPAATLLALAVLDLPVEPGAHSFTRDDHGELVLVAGGPAIVFHEQLRPARQGGDAPPLLVARQYLQDATTQVSGELLIGTSYTSRVIVSNPSSSAQQVDVLMLLPDGSLPLGGSTTTKMERLHLAAYETRALDSFFYFPHPGAFSHPSAQATREGVALAAAPARSLQVVASPSAIDPGTWSHLSQAGTDDEVLEALAARNLATLDLDRIAWRLQDRGFYDRTLALLERRRWYQATCWSYALKHRDLARAAEYLRVRGLESEGMQLAADWIRFDPQEEGLYEHLEYAPLVNPRAHGPAGARKILNDRLAAQVERLLVYLCSRPALDDEDRFAVVYYWLLQDRVDEAAALFRRIDRDKLRARLQHDYASAYLAFFDDPSRARAIAVVHADHPVDRWRDRFREILAQLDEIEGHSTAPTDPQDRDQRQTHLAATAPSLELRTTGDGLRLHHRHAPSCRVRFYEMDLELLFSQRPFGLQAFRERPPMHPNQEIVLELGPGEGAHALEIPGALRGKPLLIEATCGEARATAAHTESALVVQLSEAYGHLRVAHAPTGAPLPRVYVKVYAQDPGGAVRFHKDGYTDLRGRFDYASVSGAPTQPARFALLLLSDDHGSSLREVNAPTR